MSFSKTGACSDDIEENFNEMTLHKKSPHQNKQVDQKPTTFLCVERSFKSF